MDAASLTGYIRGAFAGVETTDAFGYTFFFFGADRMLPCATIAHTDNEYERVSNLDHPGIYRLNIGVGRETYGSLFGPEPPRLGADGIVERLSSPPPAPTATTARGRRCAGAGRLHCRCVRHPLPVRERGLRSKAQGRGRRGCGRATHTPDSQSKPL
jgi:hypothetical protein